MIERIDALPFKICADDFGLNTAVDAAILDLLAKNRINATSCMVESPRWGSDSAPQLLALLNRVRGFEVGLHFNLTETFPNCPKLSLKKILLKTYARRDSVVSLTRELNTQLDAFETAMNRTPDFIDGHQHVHQFPQVRDALLDVLYSRYKNHLPWVRNTVPPRGFASGKPLTLAILGGATLQRLLLKHNIPTNRGFLGVYDFTGDDYADKFQSWLKSATSTSLFMCHPATQAMPDDSIGAARVREYHFFNSDVYAEMVRAFSQTVAS